MMDKSARLPEEGVRKTRGARPRALVFGASGYIGSHLVPRLLEDGYRVRAVSRSREVLEGRGWTGVELAEADALQRQTLAPVLEGVDVAYYLVHSMAAGRDFGQLDLKAAGNFAQAADRAGVGRIVYLGGLVPRHADSEHLVSRALTGDRLREGGVPVTEIRAGIIVGPGSAAFEVIRDLVYNLPVMVTPRWVKSKAPPIALENLLEYLVRVPEIEAAAGQVYDVGGPEMLSYEQIMRQFAEFAGRRPLVIAVPVLTPRLSSYWLRFVTAVPTNIARALIEGLKHDIPADDRTIRQLVPQRLLSFRESMEAALKAEQQNPIAARWTEGAMMFRNYRSDYAYYAKRAGGTALAGASVDAVWNVVTAIGGANGYYYLNFLWKLRAWLDLLGGGTGMRHGRRHPVQLRVGDVLDGWRVIAMEPKRRLTLMMEMRAPGAGVLEIEVRPEGDRQTRVTATAYWHPAGVWGLLYWFVLTPVHLAIFRGMTRAIAERAGNKMAHRQPSQSVT